jgi:hypothetical protein
VSERFEIRPASLTQVLRSQRGQRIVVDDDVQNVARDLRAIRGTLVLEFDPVEEIWIVYDRQTLEDGSEQEDLVTTSLTCDQRLVQRVREVASPGYDLVAELDKVEARADRAQDEAFREQVGDAGEKLAWALRKDLGVQNRVAVPKDAA